jgi:hypothetical protein
MLIPALSTYGCSVGSIVGERFSGRGGGWRGQGFAARGSVGDRPVPPGGTARPRWHGTGVPGRVPGRATGGGQSDPRRTGGRSPVPDAIRPGGRRGPQGEWRVHRDGGGRGHRRPGGVDGYRLCSRALAGRGRRELRTAAGPLAAGAGRRPGRKPECDPRRGLGAPGSQAVERATGRGRPAGHRLRHLPRRGISNLADADRPGNRIAWFHVPRAGRRR